MEMRRTDNKSCVDSTATIKYLNSITTWFSCAWLCLINLNHKGSIPTPNHVAFMIPRKYTGETMHFLQLDIGFDLLLRLSSIFFARLAALRALSSFSCSARHRWKFSTTTPTNMFNTKKPTSRRKEMK